VTKEVGVGSEVLKAVKKVAEISILLPNPKGRLLDLSPEEVAGLRPSLKDPWLFICDPVTSFRYRLVLLDADGNFVTQPSESSTAWSELEDPLSQQRSA
jgi:hypothetical protein